MQVVLGVLAALCFALTNFPPQAADTKSSFSKPIDGPELPGPIQRPGATLEVPELDATKSGSTDPAYGAFQRGYYLTALKLALPRAESGDPAAQTLIAELYWHGRGVARDQKKAVEWYRFAANGGGREAQFSYANLLLRGEVVEEDKKLGEEFMRKAAAAGHSRAQFNVGQIITARRPTWAGFKKHYPFINRPQKRAFPMRNMRWPNIYSEAKGVPYNDDIEARKWLRKSAQGGFDAAQVDYGIWLANGRGGKKDLHQRAHGSPKPQPRATLLHKIAWPEFMPTGLGLNRT